MAQRVIQSSKRLAAERQIHAAIVHFQAGDFECAITLCDAAEGQLPKPNEPADLFGRLKHSDAEHPAPDGQKEDFNFFANWMKHAVSPDEIEIVEWLVKLWLYRAISRYHAIYGIGTPEMATLFPWAGQATMHRYPTPRADVRERTLSYMGEGGRGEPRVASATLKARPFGAH